MMGEAQAVRVTGAIMVIRTKKREHVMNLTGNMRVLMLVHRQASLQRFARFGNRSFVPPDSIIRISGRCRSISMKPLAEKTGNI